MTIIDHPSPNHSPRKVGVRVDTVLIHHTATKDLGPAVDWLCDPKSKASAHYVIGTDGSVVRLVSEDRTAWHAGLSCLPWDTQRPGASVNARSIGIEVVNPGDGVTPFTEAQYQALGELLRDIVGRLGWRYVRLAAGKQPGWLPTSGLITDPTGCVLGHRDVAWPRGRKTDPADNFDWGRIRKALAGGVA